MTLHRLAAVALVVQASGNGGQPGTGIHSRGSSHEAIRTDFFDRLHEPASGPAPFEVRRIAVGPLAKPLAQRDVAAGAIGA